MKESIQIHYVKEGNHWIAEDIKKYGNFLDRIFPKQSKLRDATQEEIEYVKRFNSK